MQAALPSLSIFASNAFAIDKGKQPPLKKRALGVNFANQRTDKKRQDSSDVGLAEKPKRRKKKTPAQVARDCARRKAYWKNIKAES